MSVTEFDSLLATILVAVFLLAAVLGAVMRETRFCTMGAVSDVVYVGDWMRMRQWALAIGVAMCGFSVLAYVGWVNPADIVYAMPQVIWLSALVGGLLFGFGMVLASGCGARNLTRLGGGSLKSLVVLVVLAVSAFATLKGITSVPRARWFDSVNVTLSVPALLPEWLAGKGWGAVADIRLWLGCGLGLVLVLLGLSAPRQRRDWHVLMGGVLVGACVAAAWALSGHFGEVQEHPETLEHMYAATYTGRIESFSFVAPVAHVLDWLLFFSDRSKVLTWGAVAVFGVVFGAFVQALVRREFRWQGFADTADLSRHLVGATLMGIGGVMALGCTVGQGISAVSALQIASFIAIAAIIAGAVIALRAQQWWLERQS
ncbi:YeeE/YedE family protein [Diaphorobacter ruginosibacter]|uniref:YeeE/YedE family protein n=1 Tax=Diaphorobacter ruginosibacter TaxID=1715720 RepID=A0A7G9RJX2_9BURK|nr:YeeE/YedE family protein [Diaphorobacter ruginosibacter]QNN55897.1 YeeE/YedE family protein [Diaphorobacter ruginosibacter]